MDAETKLTGATIAGVKDLRNTIDWLRSEGDLIDTDKEVDPDLEVVGIQKHLDGSCPILFENVNIGRHAKVRRAIIDKGVTIPAGVEIGYDLDQDRARGFAVSDGGVVVIAKSDGVRRLRDSENVA